MGSVLALLYVLLILLPVTSARIVSVMLGPNSIKVITNNTVELKRGIMVVTKHHPPLMVSLLHLLQDMVPLQPRMTLQRTVHLSRTEKILIFSRLKQAYVLLFLPYIPSNIYI